MYVSEKDVKLDNKYYDKSGGCNVTVTELPRRIAGGVIVGVVTTMWHGGDYYYCANLTNLSKR